MQSEETKKQLIETTKQLLLSVPNPEKITARQIANAANCNLAMINYCFKSKDELVKCAVEEIIASQFQQFAFEVEEQLSPKEKMKQLLYHVSAVTLHYREIAKLSVPYILLQAPIEIPKEILPYIREHFKGKKEDGACRIIAYQIVSMMQLALYRMEDFSQFFQIDLQEEAGLRAFIDNQIDLLLGDEPR